MKYQYIIYLLVSVFNYSCNSPKEYSVDTAFAEYVLRFEHEAELRGKIINLELSGLIIEFASLKDGKAGLCHYEQPIRIEIDKAYWNLISNSANADLMKENLIFHELGHGILNRRHTNEILVNGDWKSMMCGGEIVENKTWNINYRGQRRTYYVDELFKQNVEPPLFLNMNLSVDSSVFKRIIHFGFDTNNSIDTGWDLKVNQSFSLTTENKQLKFESFTAKSNAVMLNINSSLIDVNGNFLLEMNVKCIGANSTDQFGIAFGTGNNTKDTTEYFKIDNQQFMYPGNSAYFGYYTQLKKLAITKNEYNHLKVIKLDKILYYFINNRYVYQTETGILGEGKNFGFIAPAYSTTYVDNFRIGIIPSKLIHSKSNVLSPITTIIYTIDSTTNTLTH